MLGINLKGSCVIFDSFFHFFFLSVSKASIVIEISLVGLESYRMREIENSLIKCTFPI